MRFGMFIHWGLYAIPARGEWVMSNEKMSVQQYKKYFDEFNPTDFDAKRWASVCRQAGMKYAVLTAKHHDGFCLFDSKLTEYKSTNTRFGRDIVREFLEAFRAEGIAVGLYFSLLDWSHPDFPKYADRHHPMRGREEYRGEQIDFDNYLNFMHGQVKELVTGYGKLDLLWFDFSYDDMAGEKWRASDLISMVRKYQPNVCIDNRLEGSGEKYGSIAAASPLPYSGDFVSPEQIIPPHGIFDEQGERVPWELCATLNDHWGYCESDKNYKCARNEFCGDIQQKRKLRQTDCKAVGYGNRDREYQPQRFCVKPHYPSSQPQNNGVYNHIDKYQNINIDSQAPHPNIFYHGSVEKRVGICNRY